MVTIDVISCEQASDESSMKLGISLSDGQVIETAGFEFDDIYSVCLSTQVGCAMDCSFCGSGIGGFTRNLKAKEILAQLEYVMNYTGFNPDNTEASFMGIGEPLLNLEEVIKAVELMQEKSLVSQYSLSTVGIVNKLHELTKRMPVFILQLSLHAPNDTLRSKIVPMNKKQPLKEVLEKTLIYAKVSQHLAYVNYVLIDGINDSLKHARQLVTLLKDLPLRLRISRLNPINEIDKHPTSTENSIIFEKACRDGGLHVVSFASKGANKLSGCGQLRAKTLSKLL